MNGSGAVFISNVDDYLAPSQACVNPLYNSSSNDNNDQDKSKPTNDSGTIKSTSEAAVVVPRVRRRRPRADLSTTETTTSIGLPAEKKDPIKASMADCLACSGCVTTAETVLLEQQHSLTALSRQLETLPRTTLKVATISPAVFADLLRHLGIDANSNLSLWKRKLATALQHILGVTWVMDGNLPLQRSLLESAEEFCEVYRASHGNKNGNGIANGYKKIRHNWEHEQTPSVAISSQETKFMLSNGTTEVVDNQQLSYHPPSLPVLTASCPALVCLVEKSSHKAVPHLSHAKSPLSMAGAFWRQFQLQLESNGNASQSIFHLAIMPCHDKKLEASRKDFANPATQQQDVDLVVTTQEWMQLLVDYLKASNDGINQDEIMTIENYTSSNGNKSTQTTDASNENEKVRQYLESLEPAPILCNQLPTITNGITNENISVTLLVANHHEMDNDEMEVVEDSDAIMEMDTDMAITDMEVATTKAPTNNPSFFTYGSGGLSEFVFRYAAYHLFQARIDDNIVWKPVASPQQHANKVVSARVQRRAANRDYYQAILYRHDVQETAVSSTTFVYNCDEIMHNRPGTPVLRFAIAYGLQTLQRVLEPFSSTTTNNDNTAPQYPFDFVEAMACPSGCLNGGGQLRLATRETPTQTRERVALTKEMFDVATQPALEATTAMPLVATNRRTRFHVVPPLQHSMGAAAGVAVKDTQW